MLRLTPTFRGLASLLVMRLISLIVTLIERFTVFYLVHNNASFHMIIRFNRGGGVLFPKNEL